MIWQLERPKPALPNSYFWTWDHSTNWVLDDPGLQTHGCYNTYLKRPDTYLEDYRRLTDFAAGLGVAGIIIWGFLRDAHGGVDYAKRVAAYGASRGVAIMPGFGTTWYGGAYYEGEHPHSLRAFLREHPDARMLDEQGNPQEFAGEFGACPAHPAYLEWLQGALDWLLREFEIGGINIENGDMLVDYHPETRKARQSWPADDPEPFFFQGLSYRQALQALEAQLPRLLITYATYTGFRYDEELVQNAGMGKAPPAMLRVLPPASVAQWTLTGMVRKTPLPLTAFLDDGAPDAALDHPNWPADLRPPAPRNTGFLHQGSQWEGDRFDCVVSRIKEGCLRAYRAGLEGVSIHGEVSARHIPCALNYLAFSHFIHWPEDTLRDFGRKTLGPVLGSEADGERYAELLACWDGGSLTADDRKELVSRVGVGYAFKGGLEEFERLRFWQWLGLKAEGKYEGHTVSFF